MLTAVLCTLFLPGLVTIADDDGRPAANTALPAELLGPGLDLKQLKVFQLDRPCRLVNLSVRLTAPGRLQIHLWHDIDSTVLPYVPLRHFEWDVVPPITIEAPKSRVGDWINVPLNVQMNNPQKVFVGAFVRPDGPRFAEDAANGAPRRSLLEVHDTKIPGRQPVQLFQANGDYLVRLAIVPDPTIKQRLFRDVTKQQRIPKLDASSIAWGDVDGDGWEDLLVSGRRLFSNRGGERFEEVTSHAGLNGIGTDFGLFADVDNDGDLDLWLGRRSKTDADRLYLNNGQGTYQQVLTNPPADRLNSYAACWLDYNADGLVDLFVANGWSWQEGDAFEADGLWRNLGAGRFRNESESTGIEGRSAGPSRFSRAATAGDLDGDGIPELFVGTFRLLPDRLWTFRKGQAKDLAPSLNVAGGPSLTNEPGNGHALGANMADFDNDGALDLFVANLMHPDWRGYTKSNESWMFKNASARPLRFKRAAASKLGITYEETPADPDFGDFDNDGRLDAFVNSLYHSANFYLGSSRGFDDQTLRSGVSARQATASASCDFDHDGRLDLAVADKAGGFKLYRNEAPRAHWLELRLIGRTSNRAAIGAIARAKVGSAVLTRIVTSGKGMGNSDSLILHFGLGKTNRVQNLTIAWPGGHTQQVSVPKTDRLLTIRESNTGN